MKKKNYLVGYIVAVIAILGVVSLIVFAPVGQTADLESYDKSVVAKFDYINENSNSACYGIKTVMAMEDGGRIMGSCCGPMGLHAYSEQLAALKEYENFAKIPQDPYDISVVQAKELINDFKTIQLSSEQQAIYEGAKKMSMEGGPCCCGDDDLESNTCWRWKVYGGLAKYLIVEHGFSAGQVAEVWDISDGCGGDHHTGIGAGHETA